eukprot:CAMPEP_0202922836 /NCGR_PEP_ID=MMETSP1392-20130828/78133_1 /ASSEMBLY_ACC=CAM_ASM_000868 /TAXON_ID=225041 /ORGANISM="Chlamydomonas chlamydogama, Strain SAG 11-48b" /LENGTH=576 /DNA_ID=CAMNT_0049616487 /DNA_START=1623 /DNA_END=3353 /DNA_ORIENTATION=+
MAQQQEKRVPDGFKVLTEGKASILQRGNDVFYNEAQVTNRDLSTAVLRHFLPILEKEKKEGVLKKSRNKGAPGQLQQQPPKAAEEGAPPDAAAAFNPAAGARLLEGLAASGLRSIRYALEIPGVSRIDANDLDRAVVESMKRNIEFNGPEVVAKVQPQCSDARMIMMQSPLVYDAIDLDPYGTPSQLLDSAVQAVGEGGLLLITATDMANLCGNQGVACWANYGSYPIHRPYCHEMALRILLACLETHANRYKRHIVPLLSLSVDFYIRVFVRVFTSPNAVKDSPTKLSHLWQSSGCDSWWLQPVGEKKVNGNSVKYTPAHRPVVPERCPETGSGFLMGGPIWSEPIHDMAFVEGLLQDLERDKDRYAQYAKLKGLLTMVAEELPDSPLYYDLHDVCKTVKCQPPKSEVFRSALLNAGYRVSCSHANPLAIKTNAPSSVFWDIIRCWIQEHHPVNLKDKDPQSYLVKLLSKEPQVKANFARNAAAMPKSKVEGGPRYVQNPAHWGPKSKHGRPPVQPGAAVQQQQQKAKARREKGGKDKEGSNEQQEVGEDGQEPDVAEAGAESAEGAKVKKQRVE